MNNYDPIQNVKLKYRAMKKIADNHAVLNQVECNIMRVFAILAVASNNFEHLVNG